MGITAGEEGATGDGGGTGGVGGGGGWGWLVGGFVGELCLWWDRDGDGGGGWTVSPKEG